MEYRSFDEIELPNLTVTDPNPAHELDYRRFSSDEVDSFNRLQVDLIRRYSPGRAVLHNFMAAFLGFDHFKVSQSLDAASWDSYPLGALTLLKAPETHQARQLRLGDPDLSAFHHDLYRACGRGRFWIMEQQPGPVNWAAYNLLRILGRFVFGPSRRLLTGPKSSVISAGDKRLLLRNRCTPG